jgi:hypothetical protein
VLSIECVLYGVRSRLEDGVYDVTENLECFLESVLYSGREGLDLVSIRGHRPMYICTYTLSEVTDLINGVPDTPVVLTVAPGKGVCLYVCVCVLWVGGRVGVCGKECRFLFA